MSVRFRGFLPAVVLVFAGVGCGGDSNPGPSPAPTVLPPTITTSADHIFIGQTITFAATGADVRWGGDAASVATVDAATGRVIGVGNGRVTIWAENSGGRTTRLLRGLPSFAGTWGGSYAVTGCQDSGQMQSLVRFCREFSTGDILSIGLVLTQNRDAVPGGSFSLGEVQGSTNASTVAESGQLPLTGRIEVTEEGVTIVIAVENGRLESANPGIISGSFEQAWAVPGLTGTGRLFLEVRTLNRTEGGPSLAPAGTGSRPRTLKDVIEAVRWRH